MARHTDDEGVQSASYKARKDAEAARRELQHNVNEVQKLREQLSQLEVRCQQPSSPMSVKTLRMHSYSTSQVDQKMR